jgi:protein-tyrosine kinase
MSKNFELLQQIGSEGVFRTADDANADAELRAEINRLERERVLRHASLPDVFQISGRQVNQIETMSSESSASLGEETGREDLFNGSSMSAFRMESSLGREESNQVQQRAQQKRPSPKASRKARKPLRDESAENSELNRYTEEIVKKEFAGRFPSPARWIDLLRTQAKNWKWRRLAEKHHDRTELDTIAREEEIKLVQSVFPETNQDAPRMALFAGLENESGCAWICARTAEILAARAEGSVCVVDANFQSPDLHRCFNLENGTGLAEATLEPGPIQNFVQRIAGSHLWLMPGGKAVAKVGFPASAESLRGRISQLRETFRYVVIRSGPFRLDTNSMLLSRWTDGVVLVLEANSTRRESARRMKDSLASANVPVLGVVLNNRRYPIPGTLYRRF